MASIFCYGTLELEGVVKRLISRLPYGEPARLDNYVRWCIRDTDFPAIVPRKKADVNGTLYRNLSPKEVQIFDEYEGQLYKRVQVWVETEKGKTEHAWVYVLKSQHYDLLLEQPWEVENYLRFKSGMRA